MVSKMVRAMLISTIISIGLIMVAVISKDIGVFGNAILISTFVIAVPQFLLRYQRYKALKEMELAFPNFLRNLIEAINSGVPLHRAIQESSRIEFGKLSPEIRKMANQLSWGVPLDRVLNQFAERVKKSKRMFTSIKIIREAYLTGGDVASILESVADNCTTLQEASKEKKSILTQYVLIMYAISIIFVVVIIAINKMLLPIFRASAAAGGVVAIVNPCLTCYGVICSVCSLFQGTASTIFFVEEVGASAYYIGLFFYIAVIQAIFSGLVAGEISENSILAGIKHSLVLVGIVVGAFSILVRLGLMGV